MLPVCSPKTDHKMALIYDLIKTLGADELEKVSMLQLQDREREVFHFMVKTNKKVFPSSTVCKQLNIQTFHLDKINSILFKKTIEALAGESIFDQIEYLSKKNGLWNTSKHLLKSYEQKQLTEKTDAERLQFYKFSIEWYVSIPFSHQEEKQVEAYTKKIIQYAAPEKITEIKLWLRIVLLRREMKLATSKAIIKLDEQRKTLKNKMQKILTDTTALFSASLQYKAKLLAVIFYTLLEEYDKSIYYYEKAIELVNEHPDKFTEIDITVLKLYHAQTLYHASAFEECYEQFENIFHHFMNKEPLKWFMYHAEYMQVCLITGHMQTAKTICETFFASFADDINGSFYTSSHLQVIKYYLFAGEFANASAIIHKLEKYISKASLLQFQFALRELNIANNYLQNHVKKADELADKNLKFLRFKKLHKSIPEYTYHSRVVKAICRYKLTGKPMSKPEMEMYAYLQNGIMAQYGHLLKRFYEAKV